jgi:hypothetical protein
LVDAQFMAGSEMPPEHLAAPAAFQADDIIAVNRSADRHRGYPLSVKFGYRFAKSCENLINSLAPVEPRHRSSIPARSPFRRRYPAAARWSRPRPMSRGTS